MENKNLPQGILSLIDFFKSLPGIGEKTAQRLVFFLMKKDVKFLKDFGDNLSSLKEKIRECKSCFNFTEGEKCYFCESEKRDKKTLCITESPFDIISIEKSGVYNGLYFVLHGLLSPIDGITPDKLKIKELLDRIKNEEINEVLFAFSSSLEGEATSVYISNILKKERDIKITSLAKGISVGQDIEYADEISIARAIQNRISF